jgi:hypothetical protein
VTLTDCRSGRSVVQVEELKPGLRVEGLTPAEVITVIATQSRGRDALKLTYKSTAGAMGCARAHLLSARCALILI